MPRGVRTNQIKKGLVKKAKDGTYRGRPRKLKEDEIAKQEAVGIMPADQAKAYPNKKQTTLLEQLKAGNLDVITELIQYYKFNADDKTQLKILLKLLDYCFPKLRAQDFNISDEQKVVFNLALGGNTLSKNSSKGLLKQIGPDLDDSDEDFIDIEHEED